MSDEEPEDPEDNNPAPEELKGRKIGKRTGGSGKYFKETYAAEDENPYYLGETDSQMGWEYECHYCDDPVVIEKSTSKERGVIIGQNNPRPVRPPVAHPEGYPAAHVIAALNEVLIKKGVNVDNSNSTYVWVKNQVEWAFPKEKEGLFCSHTSCNLGVKDTLWQNLSQSKREKIKREVAAYLSDNEYDTMLGFNA